MILYDHPASGNCMKARILLRQLELPFERVTVDLFKGETRTPEHFARNRDGRVPVLGSIRASTSSSRTRSWRTSRRAPRTYRIPASRARACSSGCSSSRTASSRSWVTPASCGLSGRHQQLPEVYENRLERGSDALAALERGLGDGREFVAGPYSIADIALYAYVHCAEDAGAEPRGHDGIAAWLDRVEAQPRFENDLEPVPAHASERPV